MASPIDSDFETQFPPSLSGTMVGFDSGGPESERLTGPFAIAKSTILHGDGYDFDKIICAEPCSLGSQQLLDP